MKKAVSLFIAAILTLSLFGCRVGTTRSRVVNVPYSTTTRNARGATRNVTRNTRTRRARANTRTAAPNTTANIPNANVQRATPRNASRRSVTARNLPNASTNNSSNASTNNSSNNSSNTSPDGTTTRRTAPARRDPRNLIPNAPTIPNVGVPGGAPYAGAGMPYAPGGTPFLNSGPYNAPYNSAPYLS
ncbi:MAG: hypothetical protein LBT36_01425 [Oscillospiraceae bacterium]|nr:hypothetical protein [Oscillospiraceae bacterium]